MIKMLILTKINQSMWGYARAGGKEESKWQLLLFVQNLTLL